MKKLLGTFSILAAVFLLSACGGVSIPQCVDELDECGRDGPYTEERTAYAGTRYVAPEPASAPEPAPAPAPAPVVEPEPAPVVDTQVMRSAEPQFKQISK